MTILVYTDTHSTHTHTPRAYTCIINFRRLNPILYILIHTSHESAAPVVFGIRFDELSWVSTDASRRPTECTEDFSVVYKEVEIFFVQALFRYGTGHVCSTCWTLYVVQIYPIRENRTTSSFATVFRKDVALFDICFSAALYIK